MIIKFSSIKNYFYVIKKNPVKQGFYVKKEYNKKIEKVLLSEREFIYENEELKEIKYPTQLLGYSLNYDRAIIEHELSAIKEEIPEWNFIEIKII